MELEGFCKVCKRHFKWEPTPEFEWIIKQGCGWAPPSTCSKTCYLEWESQNIADLMVKHKKVSEHLLKTIKPLLAAAKRLLDDMNTKINEITDLDSEVLRRSLHYHTLEASEDWRYEDIGHSAK